MPSAVSQPTEQAIAMTGPAGHASMGYAEGGEIGPDGRKAKRELSQSKRAAQNRAAQVRRLSVSLHCPLLPTLVSFRVARKPRKRRRTQPFRWFQGILAATACIPELSQRAIRVLRVGRRLIIAFASREAGRPGRWQVHNTAPGWSHPCGPDSNSRDPLFLNPGILFHDSALT